MEGWNEKDGERKEGGRGNGENGGGGTEVGLRV